MSIETTRKKYASTARAWRTVKTVLMYLILSGMSALFLIPFFWMLSTSLTDEAKVRVKDRSWIPNAQVMMQVGGESLPLYRIKQSKPVASAAEGSSAVIPSVRGKREIVAQISSSVDSKTVREVVGGKIESKIVDGKKVWTLIGGKLVGESRTFDENQLVEVAKFTPVWINYPDALTVLPFTTFLKNTLIITLLCIIGQTLSASLVAFGFSRMKFPGRDFLFIMVLSTMMLPAQVTMIPTFVLFVKLRWIDTLRPLIVPAFFGGGAFFIFLLRQFFLTLPSELEDAAKMDGCSALGVFRNVALPLSKPALATVAVFSFMAHWNDFMGPLIYTQSMEKKTLALGLYSFKGLHGTEYHLMMAAAIAVLFPVLIIFFSAQKYFVQGIVMSGIKG